MNIELDTKEHKELQAAVRWGFDIDFSQIFFLALLEENEDLYYELKTEGTLDTVFRESLLDAIIVFFKKGNRYPSYGDNPSEKDMEELNESVKQAYQEWEAENFW